MKFQEQIINKNLKDRLPDSEWINDSELSYVHKKKKKTLYAG